MASTFCSLSVVPSGALLIGFDFEKIIGKTVRNRASLEIACVADVIVTLVSNVCEAAPRSLLLGLQRTQRITGSAFRISFHLDCQIDDGFLNRPIYSNPGVHMWGAQNEDFGANSQTDLTRVSFRQWRRLLNNAAENEDSFIFLSLGFFS